MTQRSFPRHVTQELGAYQAQLSVQKPAAPTIALSWMRAQTLAAMSLLQCPLGKQGHAQHVAVRRRARLVKQRQVVVTHVARYTCRLSKELPDDVADIGRLIAESPDKTRTTRS